MFSEASVIESPPSSPQRPTLLWYWHLMAATAAVGTHPTEKHFCVSCIWWDAAVSVTHVQNHWDSVARITLKAKLLWILNPDQLFLNWIFYLQTQKESPSRSGKIVSSEPSEYCTVVWCCTGSRQLLSCTRICGAWKLWWFYQHIQGNNLWVLSAFRLHLSCYGVFTLINSDSGSDSNFQDGSNECQLELESESNLVYANAFVVYSRFKQLNWDRSRNRAV